MQRGSWTGIFLGGVFGVIVGALYFGDFGDAVLLRDVPVFNGESFLSVALRTIGFWTVVSMVAGALAASGRPITSAVPVSAGFVGIATFIAAIFWLSKSWYASVIEVLVASLLFALLVSICAVPVAVTVRAGVTTWWRTALAVPVVAVLGLFFGFGTCALRIVNGHGAEAGVLFIANRYAEAHFEQGYRIEAREDSGEVCVRIHQSDGTILTCNPRWRGELDELSECSADLLNSSCADFGMTGSTATR